MKLKFSEIGRNINGIVNVIIDAPAFSAAGQFNLKEKKLTTNWATAPKKYKTKENKILLEQFCSNNIVELQ